MKYAVVHPDIRKRPSTVITCDGKVVWTTPALKTWIGYNFMDKMYMYRGAKWLLLGTAFEVPNDHS